MIQQPSPCCYPYPSAKGDSLTTGVPAPHFPSLAVADFPPNEAVAKMHSEQLEL